MVSIVNRRAEPSQPAYTSQSGSISYSTDLVYTCPFTCSAQHTWQVYSVDPASFVVTAQVPTASLITNQPSFTLSAGLLSTDGGLYRVVYSLNLSVLAPFSEQHFTSDGTYVKVAPGKIIHTIIYANIVINSNNYACNNLV